jgi:hypothetical protein
MRPIVTTERSVLTGLTLNSVRVARRAAEVELTPEHVATLTAAVPTP